VFEIESLIEHGAEKLCKQSVGGMNMYCVSQKLKLQRDNEFVTYCVDEALSRT